MVDSNWQQEIWFQLLFVKCCIFFDVQFLYRSFKILSVSGLNFTVINNGVIYWEESYICDTNRQSFALYLTKKSQSKKIEGASNVIKNLHKKFNSIKFEIYQTKFIFKVMMLFDALVSPLTNAISTLKESWQLLKMSHQVHQDVLLLLHNP